MVVELEICVAAMQLEGIDRLVQALSAMLVKHDMVAPSSTVAWADAWQMEYNGHDLSLYVVMPIGVMRAGALLPHRCT